MTEPAGQVMAMEKPVTTCFLCGAPIPDDGRALCPECDEDQREKWADYWAEQEQVRRPL